MSSRGGSYRGDGARGRGGYSRGQSSGNFRGRDSGAPRGGGGYSRGGDSSYGRGRGSDYSRGGQGRGRGSGGGDRGGRGEHQDIIDPNLISRGNVNWNYNTSQIGAVKPEFVPRKGHLSISSSDCRQIQLMTNHFAFKFPSDVSIYHYDFSWLFHGPDANSKPLEKKLGRDGCYILFDAVLDQQAKYFKGLHSVGFDGSKNVYLPYKLKCINGRLGVKDVKMEGLSGDFSVAFKLVNTIQLKSLNDYYNGHTASFPKETIQALEVIMKFPSRSDTISLGRYALFPVDGDRLYLSNWMELALGHRKSLRLSEIGLTLVVDRAATAFRKSGRAIDFLRSVLSEKGENIDREFKPSAYQLEVIKRAFFNMKVETDHLGFPRFYKIKNISENAASFETFIWDEGDYHGEITVADYFEKKYGKRLRYPYLPCLKAGKSANIPIELCHIVSNQHPSTLAVRLSPEEQAEMIKLTATRPDSRFTCLLQAHGQIRQTINETLVQFGLDVDIKPIGVTGVVLRAPTLIFGTPDDKKKTVTPNNGKWDLKECTFYKNKTFKQFGVLNFCGSRGDVQCFVDMFIKKANQMKMMIGSARPVMKDMPDIRIATDKEKSDKITVALQEIRNTSVAFCLCIFPPDKTIYNLTKRIGDTTLLFPTQGVAIKNVKRCSEQLIANILAKINKKLGGVNLILNHADKPALLKKKIMIVGADVTHPGEADELYSSVAASVSTYDQDHTMFYPSVRVQPKKVVGQSVTETIVDFQSMIQEHLDNFKAVNKFLPDVILYLRDGVSEGQYAQILTQEVKHLLRPYGMSEKYTPKVTAVIISKRIQTRTRPVNPGDAVGRAGNVPPGTTIDSIITHPSDFDYFQYGHEGIQGTSRPCHYFLVHDDNNLNCTEMSKISFHLCHLFERCTRSTSAPAPVMHAHNLAYRARQWIVGAGDKQNLRGYGKEERTVAELKLARNLNEKVKNLDPNFRRQSMFFF